MVTGMDQTKRKGWYPHQPLEGKHNWKRIYQIYRDGSVVDCVFLNICDPRVRENVIAIHFLNANKEFIVPKDDIDLLTARDDPWDFTFSLRSGLNLHFEIVSISDNIDRFISNRLEEKIDAISHLQTIPLSRLIKSNEAIPHPDAQNTIDVAKKDSMSMSQHVPNPWYKADDGINRIFVSKIRSPEKSLYQLVDEAILAKENKRHTGKDRTILIIDNRTGQFDVDDFHLMVKSSGGRFDASPFMQIWIYTGYYSDLDGSNAEYAWSVIKADDDTFNNIARKLASTGALPDQNGVVERTD